MQRVNQKKGFTLFELMIVMVIIALVYGMFVQNFSTKQVEQKPKVEKLREFLLNLQADSRAKISVICTQSCKICKLYINDKEKNANFDLFENEARVSAYKLVDNSLEDIEFDDLYTDRYTKEEVCFRYNLYPNSSSDKMILEYNDRFFLYDNYFYETKEFTSIEEAKQSWYETKLKAKG